MYIVQTVNTAVLAIIAILFSIALFVELVEYEAIAKLLVIPMLAIGIAVSGYSVFKSLKHY